MALSERTVVDQVTVDEFGRTFIRERTDILRDGEVVSHSFHRRVIDPADSLASEDARIAAIAKAGRKDAQPLPK